MADGYPIIGFNGDATQVAHRAAIIDEEMADRLSRFGEDPARYNRMVWPLGASRHAECHILMHKDDAEAALSVDSSQPRQFQFGDISFGRMWLRSPRPVLIHEGLGAFYDVTVVDERFFWQHASYGAGAMFNMTADGRTHDASGYYRTTLDPAFDHPWGPRTLAETLVGLLDQADVAEFDLSALAETSPISFITPHFLTDLDGTNQSIAEIIDRILLSAGYVLRAHRNSDDPRYDAVRIATGDTEAIAALNPHSADLVAGGVYATRTGVSGIGGGAGPNAKPLTVFAHSEVPDQVEVLFPTAMRNKRHWTHGDQTESTSTGRHHYTRRRAHAVLTSFGRPAGIGGTVARRQVFTQFHAEINPVTGAISNAAAVDQVADDTAALFYDRYRAGACDVLLRGTVDIDQWAGAQELVYSFVGGERYTRLRGDIHWHGFGFDDRRPLTARDIYSTGDVRAMRRFDGGVMFDSIANYGDVHWGRITGTNSPPSGVHARYDAVAQSDPNIAVIDAQPIRSDVESFVRMNPAQVGDDCLMGIRTTPDTGAADAIEILAITETRPTIDCETAGRSISQSEQLTQELSLNGVV